jgi:hypothetical protein
VQATLFYNAALITPRGWWLRLGGTTRLRGKAFLSLERSLAQILNMRRFNGRSWSTGTCQQRHHSCVNASRRKHTDEDENGATVAVEFLSSDIWLSSAKRSTRLPAVSRAKRCPFGGEIRRTASGPRCLSESSQATCRWVNGGSLAYSGGVTAQEGSRAVRCHTLEQDFSGS